MTTPEHLGPVNRDQWNGAGSLLRLALPGLLSLGLAAGCVSVKAPDEINVGYGKRVDSSRVPPTSSHAEAREELALAYAEINRLEDKVADLREDVAELEEENRELDRALERYEDRYDD